MENVWPGIVVLQENISLFSHPSQLIFKVLMVVMKRSDLTAVRPSSKSTWIRPSALQTTFATIFSTCEKWLERLFVGQVFVQVFHYLTFSLRLVMVFPCLVSYTIARRDALSSFS